MGDAVRLFFRAFEPNANHPEGGHTEVSSLNPLPVSSSGGSTAGGVVSVAAVSSVNSSASVQTLLAANANRKGVVIVNTDANDLYIKYGSGAAIAGGGWSYKISTGVTWEMPWSMVYTGIITGIWSAAGAGLAEITAL